MRCPDLASSLILGVMAATVAATPQDPLPGGPAPEVFVRELASRLTPRPIGDHFQVARSAAADGVVLLDEEVIAVDHAGGATVAVHQVLLVRTPRGVDRAERIVLPFRPATERVQVIDAHWITPDGRVHPLPPNAVLREKPQALVEHRIYADIEQVVMLFPAVRPGDQIEFTLVREVDPAMDGEFSTFLPIADPWPVTTARRELLVPASWAPRLATKLLGLEAAATGREAVADDRASVWWSFADLPPLELEKGRQPIRQGGPGLWVSTVASWESLARWYEGLLSGRDALDPELARQVATWTEGVGEPSAMVATLCRRIAEQVRYLGLEFGTAAVQPRAATEVWSTGFGDCKDLANLLRAMLASRGVESNLLLVNTQHAGRLELATPSHRQFDHVILGVPTPDGGFLVCDPSAPDLPPGELLSTVGGRQALVIGDESRTLVELPEASAGTLSVAFDLTLTPQRHLYGWMTVEADTAQSSLVVRRLLAGTADERLASAQGLLTTFFTEPTAIDLQAGPPSTGGAPRSVRVFFRATATVDPRGARIRFPTSEVLLPRSDAGERRETPFFQPLGGTRLRVDVRLPAGWAVVGELPAPLSVDAGALVVAAGWQSDVGLCSGSLEYRSTRSVVEPSAFVALTRARAAASEWLETPILVGPAEGAVTAAAQPELPRLPTGEGQLQLVELMFPRDLDPEGRRSALSKVEGWFADDATTALEAGLELAILDQDAGLAARSVERMRDLLVRHGEVVDPALKGWAEHILANGLRESGSVDEARQIYDRLSRQPDLPAHRRGWAYARAAAMRLETEPLTALAILDEAVRLESPALEQQVALLVRVMLAIGQDEAIDARLEAIGTLHPHRALDVHSRLLDEVKQALDRADLARAEALVRILERRVATARDLTLLAADIAAARTLLEDGLACREIAGAVREHFAAHPPTWWCSVAPAGSERDLLVAALQRLDRTGDVRSFVRTAVEVITRFQVAPDFFGFVLWRCAQHLETAGDEPELHERFLGWCRELPEGNRFRQAAGA